MVNEDQDSGLESPDAAPTDVVYLRTGEALDADAVAVLGAHRPYRLIVLAGEPGCGKTTLLASMYAQFLSGPLGEYSFAGSETLVGFERRCHASRAESGLTIADTERTLGAAAYLHLRLAVQNVARDVVFTDVPGENFRLARDLSTEGSRLGYVRRADRFVLLLDGAKISEPSERQAVVQNARMLLRSLRESGMLNTRSSVAVVFTKADLWESQAARSPIAMFLETSRQRLSADFADSFGEFSLYEVAARPAFVPPNREALAAILHHWMSGEKPVRRQRPVPSAVDLSPYERFALFESEGAE